MKRILLFLNVVLLLCINDMFSQAGVTFPVTGITTFANPTNTTLATSGPCVPSKTASAAGWSLSVASSSNCAIVWVGSGVGTDGHINTNATPGGFQWLGVTYGSVDGSEFKLEQANIATTSGPMTGFSYVFNGYRNGVLVAGASLTSAPIAVPGVTNGITVTFTNNAAFNNIDEFRIVPTNASAQGNFFMLDITVATAVAPCITPTLNVASSLNVLCNGASTGSAAVTASGGPPYTYTWSPSGGNAASATALSAGNYTCTVTNSCGATATATVAITQSPVLNLSPLSQTNISCNGGNNGAASVNPASGGAGGYTYNWTPGNPAGDGTTSVTGLTAGTWSCTVTDANSCSRTQTFNIVAPPTLNLSPLSQTNVSCNGGNNGAASVNPASGGAGGYTYNWTPGNPAGDGTTNVTGLVAGTWSCTVTDANSCTRTQTFTITQPSALTLTPLSQTNVSCNGVNNGAASVNPASGGAGGYTYNWTPGNPAGDGTTNVTGLVAGTWSCTVMDANSCALTQTFTITQPSALTLTPLSQTNVSCNGGNNGAASVNPASGGAGGYTYNWTPGNPAGDGTTNVTGLVAGTWSCTVMDANSCTLTQTFTITQPSVLNTATAVTNVLCFGNSTGAATVTASGGAGSYTYLWSSAQTTSVVSGLNAGVRTVTVTDANGCTATNTVVITQPGSALATATAVTNVLCFGNSTGAATVTASGGAGSYTYLWSSAQTTSVISGLNAGVRTVTVTDGNGCTATNVATITQPASGIITATGVTNVLCNGGSTGSATVTASGGAGSYTYLWSTAQTTSVISGLNAGVRTVTVTDGGGCSTTNTVIVTQPSVINTATAVTNVLCFGNSTGAATVTASGGAGSYTYLWSTAQTTSVISGLNAGVRTVTVTDANGCTATNTVVITQPGSALATATAVTNVLCFGNSTGAATVTASGGAGSYTYLWSSAQTSSVISGLNAGVRTVTVTDGNGCTATNTVTVTQPASGIITTTGVTNVLCNGGSTGSATVTASGGAGSYTYLWSTAQTTSVISGLNAGVRTVTVTDGGGCSTTNTVIITQPAALTVTVSPSSLSLCSGNSGTLTGNAGGGTGVISYSWSTGATNSIVVVSPVANTNYTLVATDANACTISAVRTVSVNTTPTVSALSGSICSGQSFTINPSGASTYTYSGGSAVVSPATTSSYSVTGTSAQGCVSSNTAVVTVSVNAIPVISASSQTICTGATTTLTASGASTYSWNTGATTNSIVVTPTATTVYTVNGNSAAGCGATAVTVTVTLGAGPSISVNSSTICSGNSATLTASGVNSYTWSTGANTSSIIVSPSSAIVYTVSGNLSGCAVTASNTATVSVNTTPTVSALSGSICSGQSFTINPSGASTYTYSGGSAVVSPATTSSYSVTGTSAQGCVSSNTAVVTVSVNAIPVISASSQTICTGATTTLTASGASTYSWNTGATTNSIVVTPTATTVYTVNGNSAAGCGATAVTVTVTLGAGPSISVNSSTICSGNSATLTASGVNTYTWSTGANTSSIIVSPSSATVYTVSGNLSGCAVTASNTATVSVNTTPTVSALSGSICSGQSFTINPSGATTYTYSGGSAVVSPATTSSYSVTGTSAQGCVSSNTAVVTVSVNAIPVISASSQTICTGATTTLTASGASTYSWNTGATTNSIVVTPTATTVYTVNGNSAAGCGATAVTVTVTLGAGPSISVNSSTICSGNSATLTASGVNSYTWSTGANTSSIIVSPSSAIVYTVSGNLSGCAVTASNTATVSVNTTPTVSALSGSICSGQSFTINPSGASTYTYSGGSAVVSPATTSSYSITGTSAQGCVSIPAVVVVTVNTIPVLAVSSQTICSGGTATLTASGASTYSWSTGATTGSITVTPTVNTTYTLNGLSASGCTAIPVTASVVLGPAPSLTVNSATICAGESVTLAAVGVSSYSWSTGASTSSIVVSPSTTTVYTLSGQQAGCPVVVTASAGVQVNAVPIISVSGNTVLCAGQSTSLTALGASSYSWSTGAASSQIAMSPSVTTSYTVTGTNTVTGCKNVFVQPVIVNALPTVGINGSLTVCNGNATVLNANGALSYTWNTGSSSPTLSVNPSVTTNYSVSGVDANGCLGSASVTVNVSAVPVITISGGSVCAGQSFTFSPSGAISYTYNPGGSQVVTPSATTIYTISGSNAAGCTGSSTVAIGVLVTPTVSAGTDIIVTSGDTFTLTGTTNAPSYTWSPSQGLSSPTSLQPTGTAQATTVFTLTVNSAGGCTASSTVMLVVNNLPVNNRLLGELQIANYMSPNGDGQNDTWKVNNPSLIKDYEVNIVDQWGNPVYSKNGNYNNDWDGTRNGQVLPDGVYYYIISEGGNVKYSGSITILK